MPLALTVEKIDTVPEAQRALYVEKDGKFHLDVSDLPDVAGLKNALESERTARKALDKDVAAWKKLGKTPEEIAELTAAAEAAAEAAAKKAGKHDEILAAKLAAAAKERAESEAKLSGERDSALGLARKAIVDTRLTTALTKAKVTAEGGALLPEILAKRVKLDFTDGAESISILAVDGTPMVGSAKDGTATFEDLAKEAVKSFPSLFEGSGAGGGGTDQKGQRQPTGGKLISRKDFESLGPLDRAAKMKEGFKLVD